MYKNYEDTIGTYSRFFFSFLIFWFYRTTGSSKRVHLWTCNIFIKQWEIGSKRKLCLWIVRSSCK